MTDRIGSLSAQVILLPSRDVEISHLSMQVLMVTTREVRVQHMSVQVALLAVPIALEPFYFAQVI